MPNTLDVAKQRKLIEDLKRGGQTTLEAESRLKDMLDFIVSFREYRAAPVAKVHSKPRQSRADQIVK